MSKLDVNERWKAKIILPEFREEYESKGEQPEGRATTAELCLIRGYVMYPHLTTMMQKSIEDMTYTTVTLKALIIRCLEQIMFSISDDFFALKREMKRLNIRVVEEDMNDEILYFRYFCRGYEDRFGIVRDTLRTEIRLLLTSYTNDFGRQLKNRP